MLEKKADKALNNKDYDKAIHIYEELIQLDPREAARVNKLILECSWRLGNMLTAQNRISEAEAVYNNVLKIDPNNANAHFKLGILYLDQKRYSESDAKFRRLLNNAPNSALLHANLGRSLLSQNRYSEAEESFRNAIKNSEDKTMSAVLYFFLGTTLQEQLRYGEAIKIYGEALKNNNPNDMETSSLIISAMIKSEELQKQTKHNALEQAKSTQMHGIMANDPSKYDETASAEARKGFDTSGNRSQSAKPPVDMRGTSLDVPLSPKIVNHPTYKILQEEEDRLFKMREALELELLAINKKKGAEPENKGRYAVEEVKKKQRINEVTNKIYMIKVKKRDFIVKFDEQEAPKDKAKSYK